MSAAPSIRQDRVQATLGWLLAEMPKPVPRLAEVSELTEPEIDQVCAALKAEREGA
jgi:hypothetical protein